MLGRSWDILKDFENKYKKDFLNSLTQEKSLEIFKNLYLLVQETVGKNYFKKLNSQRIQVLTKVHSIFMRVK